VKGDLVHHLVTDRLIKLQKFKNIYKIFEKNMIKN